MDNPYKLFAGMALWGSEFLPGDIVLSPNEIREWAFREGLVDDPEFQLITSERAEAVGKLFTVEDRLCILVHVYQDDAGKLGYLEYVYVPIATLIKKGIEIGLVWWQMVPTMWDSMGRVEKHGEVQFGFWLPESSEEFCTESTGKLIVEKFKELSGQIERNCYKVKELSGGALDVEVDGDVKARFCKTGRYFDVEFSWISDKEKQRRWEATRKLAGEWRIDLDGLLKGGQGAGD